MQKYIKKIACFARWACYAIFFRMEGKEDYPRLANGGRFGKAIEMLFGRGTIVAILFLLQLAILALVLMNAFQRYRILYFCVSSGSQFAMTVYLLNARIPQNIKLGWITFILLFPVVGIPLYLFLRLDFGHRAQKKILGQELRKASMHILSGMDAFGSIEDPREMQAAFYLRRYAASEAFTGTCARYFAFGQDAFPAMLDDLEKAEEFIFLEYFIIDEGYMWGNILSILERKAKEGVEVRVMFDGLNAFARLPYDYPRRLERLGIKAMMFAPIRPFVSTHYNNRDHRKILVVDDRIGYTGGINLADEYIGRRIVHGLWKDNALRLEGEAVSGLTLTFLSTWNAIGRDGRYEEYLKRSRLPGSGLFIPFADSPLDEERVGESVYQMMLGNARSYCWIMTPYLILDGELEDSISRAARRGVDVRIVLPHVPDKKYAFALARTHYRALLDAGVSIYEYTPGFIHSKVCLRDDGNAVVGTINFDYRSLYLHFENAVYLSDRATAAAIREDFLRTFEVSEKIDAESWRNRGAMMVAGGLLKLFAPLM